MTSILCVVFAFILILKGGDLLVESSIHLAKKAKIPTIIVGATVVAIATTFPEISVSIISGRTGAEEIAVSTALGSMVCNFALVLGLAFLVSPSKIENKRLGSKVAFFLISLVALGVLALDQKLGLVDAVILVLVFLGFMIFNIVDARNSTPTIQDERLPSWGKTVLQFFISALAIGFGANVLVSSIDELSAIMGISEGLLGVFVISVGTNIPEFVTTMTAIRMGNTEIGIGNIFGASLIDATLLLSLTTFSKSGRQIYIPSKLLLLTLGALFLITAVIVYPISKKGKSSRLQGGLLLAIFLAYSLLLTRVV